jgi:hypothetical protein
LLSLVPLLLVFKSSSNTATLLGILGVAMMLICKMRDFHDQL